MNVCERATVKWPFRLFKIKNKKCDIILPMVAVVKNDKKILSEVVKIIRKHLGEECKIFLFGSRVDGSAQERSDYDIGIMSTKDLPMRKLGKIREEIENLPTLYKIDIVDFRNVSENFYAVAMKKILYL